MLLFLRLYSVTFATWGTSLSSTVRLGSQCQIPTVRRLRDQLHEVQDTVSLKLRCRQDRAGAGSCQGIHGSFEPQYTSKDALQDGQEGVYAWFLTIANCSCSSVVALLW
jgi:hypothetical protein